MSVQKSRSLESLEDTMAAGVHKHETSAVSPLPARNKYIGSRTCRSMVGSSCTATTGGTAQAPARRRSRTGALCVAPRGVHAITGWQTMVLDQLNCSNSQSVMQHSNAPVLSEPAQRPTDAMVRSHWLCSKVWGCVRRSGLAMGGGETSPDEPQLSPAVLVSRSTDTSGAK